MNATTADARRRCIARAVRPDVRALTRYEVPDAAGFVKLDAMENPYALPPELARALGAALSRVAINRYPDADARAAKDALRDALSLPPEAGLLLGNGSDELIQIVTSTLVRPDAGVLAPDPSFVMYRRNALMAQAPFEAVALRSDFSLDVDAMLAAIERAHPALVFLAYPNNPTGNLFDAQGVERIIRAAPGLVAIDEAYYAFADASFLPRVLDFPNLIVIRTVSKIGMAGLRLGYAVGHPDWIGEFDKLRPPYNVGSLAQSALPPLLAHAGVFAEQAEAIKAERTRVADALGAFGARVFPTKANFVLARVRDADAAFTALLAAKILVKNLHGSHPLLAQCLRITIGTPDQNEALLDVLERHLMQPAR
ncbi:MAG TPA: histidinol-phosphate transaminase [Casimicrobiaceae bacterium]